MHEATRHAGEWESMFRQIEAVDIHISYFVSVSYVKFLRRTRAAVVIQRNVRMLVARRRFLQQRSAAITVQCFLRAYMARKQYYKVMLLPKKVWRLLEIKPV